MNPVLRAYLAAADGRFPPVDGVVEVLPPLDGGLEAVVEFTGHSFIATRHPSETLMAMGVHGFGGASQPDVLRLMAGPAGEVGVIDATLVARGRGDGRLPLRDDLEDHHRVLHARKLRRDVRVHGDERGLVTLATGLAGRLEISVEAEPRGQGRGWGRALVEEGLRLAPEGAPVFAAVAPGNARSLRAFLGLGFVPVGSECIVVPEGAGRQPSRR